MAMYAEAHRDRKKRPKRYTFKDFYPFKKQLAQQTKRKYEDLPKADISILKNLLNLPERKG